MIPLVARASVLLLVVAPLAARDDGKAAEPAHPAPEELRFESEHSLDAGGIPLRYRAVAETTHLRDDAGEPGAEFFTIAHELLSDADPAERPVTFASTGCQRFTGLSPEYLRRANLRVSTDRFRRELLRDRGLVVGRLDTRYTGTEPDHVGEVPSGDPFGSGVSGDYVAGLQHDLRSDLGVTVEREYEVMSRAAGEHWKRPEEEWPAFQGHVDVAPALARGMAENPDLRVFIANGLYDIATSFFAAENNVARSTMDPARVVLRNYPAGHMMYVHHPTRVALARDLKAFVAPAGE